MLRTSLLRAPRMTFGLTRAYSVQTSKKLPDIDASKLTVTRTQTPKEMLKPEELVFGRTFSGEFFSYVTTVTPVPPHIIRKGFN